MPVTLKRPRSRGETLKLALVLLLPVLLLIGLSAAATVAP